MQSPLSGRFGSSLPLVTLAILSFSHPLRSKLGSLLLLSMLCAQVGLHLSTTVGDCLDLRQSVHLQMPFVPFWSRHDVIALRRPAS